MKNPKEISFLYCEIFLLKTLYKNHEILRETCKITLRMLGHKILVILSVKLQWNEEQCTVKKIGFKILSRVNLHKKKQL